VGTTKKEETGLEVWLGVFGDVVVFDMETSWIGSMEVGKYGESSDKLKEEIKGKVIS